ncbi:MAG TPA: hypothetical protein VK605_04535 [Solirubrobacteraceae bacterium]|nr:hypothetical protein [Solirubrobacteraceae bacterium]
MIHRTYRSLDEAPKLVGFTVRQWAALITGTGAMLGVIYLAHLPAKPAITLCVFVIGLPAALTYVSESGGLQLGVLLRDMCHWRLHRQLLAAVPAGFDGGRGLVVIDERGDHLAQGDLPASDREASHPPLPCDTLDSLVGGERWER